MFTLSYEDAQKGAGHMLKIEAMQTKRSSGRPQSVEFFSYLEAYGDGFDSNWNVEDAFGRMDGIANYINTKRSINLSFKIPAADFAQGKENMHKISQLARFLYPGIEEGQKGNIKTAPVLRLRFGNLIQDASTRGGLFGFIEGRLNVVPMKEAGYFTPIEAFKGSPKGAKRDEITDIKTNSTIVPKVIDISFTFKPLHNHLLGHKGLDETFSDFAEASFPYGFTRREFENEKEAIKAPDASQLYGGSTVSDTSFALGTEGNPDFQSLTELDNVTAIDYLKLTGVLPGSTVDFMKQSLLAKAFDPRE